MIWLIMSTIEHLLLIIISRVPSQLIMVLFDWIEYMWVWNSYHKLFGYLLEKNFTIFWTILTHWNEIVFKGHKNNPITILGKAHYMFCYTMLYNKKTNIIYSDVSPSNQLHWPAKKFSKLVGSLPLLIS